MYYSKTIGGFIPTLWMTDGTYNPVPTDAIELSIDEELEFRQIPPSGKMLDVVSGKLTWVDLPPLSQAELVAQAEVTRKSLLAVAKHTISIWQSELLLESISDANKASLMEWIAYINAVQTVDTSTVPISWPVPPTILKTIDTQ